MNIPILDIYDDHAGGTLTRLLPQPDNVPDFIKQANPVVGSAPDEDFALLLHGQDGVKKRKYACVDAGNTALSVLYFMENKNLLPEEMRKVAAHNLTVACRRFGLVVPPMLEKQAEGVDLETEGSHATVHFEESYLEELIMAEPRFKTASGMALDTIDEVADAVEYFTDYHRRLHPRDRRELAIPVEKRASALGVETTPELQRYSSPEYAFDLGVGIAARESLLTGSEYKGLYDELYKRASDLSPEVFAETLTSLDNQTGLSEHWDSHVPDPYYSTFAKTAEAEYEFTDGVDKVTGTDLQRLARNGKHALNHYFPDRMVDGFVEKPITIFKSLPQPQKKIIMRMAQDNDFPGGEAT